MIAISPIRTRRLQAEMAELTVGDVIYLCRLPAEQNEVGVTELLRKSIRKEEAPKPGIVTDPRLWTAQERYFAVAHYIAHITDGESDFAVGEARFSDYLFDGQDHPPEPIALGVVAEDNWHMQALLGAHAESIERLIIGDRIPAGRVGWWFGAMAVQMFRTSEQPFDLNQADAALDDFIGARVEILQALPERMFLDLLFAFLDGNRKLDHILRLEFIDSGIVFMPAKAEVPGNAPARFPFSRCLSELSLQAFA